MSGGADQNQNLPAGAAITTQTTATWAESFVSVLESMTAQRPTIAVRPSISAGWEEGLAWWGQKLSILEQPSFWIGAPAKSWDALGRLILSALGVEDPADGDIQATCRDVLAQTSAMVAAQLTSQFGEEISGKGSLADSQPQGDAAAVFTWSMDAGSMSMEGTAVWAEAFLQRCSAFTSMVAPAGSRSEESSTAPGGETSQLGGRPADSIPRLDLRVVFLLGSTTLPLREIFKLNVGSVIELNHSAIEPAEVVIHGRVVARGQVVVVNGNYGLKILPQ
jgi:flagellar motor switch protein FliN/FliY